MGRGAFAIGAAAGDVLHVPRIDDTRLQTPPVEDFEKGNPVDARRFHGHGGDSTTRQPIRHLVEIFGEGAEAADWLAIRIER